MRTTTPELFPPHPSAPRADREPALAQGLFAQVAVNRPIRCEFTYAIPEQLEERVSVGVRVDVPFGPRKQVGVVVGVTRETDVPPDKLRSLVDVLDPAPIIGRDLLDLTRWMAEEYASSWGEALHGVLPAALRRGRGPRKVTVLSVPEGVGKAQLAELESKDSLAKQFRLLRTLLEIGEPIEMKDILRQLGLSDSPAATLARRGWVTIGRAERKRDELMTSRVERTIPHDLTPDQSAAVSRITAALEERRHETFLLRGVTGSGKTEVYLRVIARALAKGLGAIVLVPEIALTPQTVGWFRSRFGDVAVLHSRMSDASRLHTWQRLRRGEVRVVVGARSALFAPMEDVGVVVIDEEHEPSFKQSSTPRYHAREVAVERARAAGAVCILGSATPSLESDAKAARGEYVSLELPHRVGGGTMPEIEIVDMRVEASESREVTLFSRSLRGALRQVIERNEQAILFQNRRGFSPVLWCQACRETVRCKHCDQSLAFHRRIGRLLCHTCCEEIAPPKACPGCTAPQLRYLGAGSERIEKELADLLPTARVVRMDSDTMRRREDYEEALGAFGRGEVDVLVGTQMIAKGLDFPRVTLVGIVSADVGLHLPDFRAAERTFQLISQVAGRAGRGKLEGRIVIQTLVPEHPAVRLAARNDYRGFVTAESEARADLGYPPHGRLIRAVFEDQDEGRVAQAADRCAEDLRKALPQGGAVVLGPAPAPLSRVRGRHRHHLLVKAHWGSEGGRGREAFTLARTRLRQFATSMSRPRIAIDVDPVSLL